MGDKYEGTQTIYKGQAKFAEMELHGSNAKFLKALLGTEGIALPYILIYQGSNGLVRSFDCAPKNIQVLVDAVEELSHFTASNTYLGDGHESNQEQAVQPSIVNSLKVTVRDNKNHHHTKGPKGLGVTNLYLSTLSACR